MPPCAGGRPYYHAPHDATHLPAALAGQRRVAEAPLVGAEVDPGEPRPPVETLRGPDQVAVRLLRRPDDELRYEVGRRTVTGNTDRFTLKFVKE